MFILVHNPGTHGSDAHVTPAAAAMHTGISTHVWVQVQMLCFKYDARTLMNVCSWMYVVCRHVRLLFALFSSLFLSHLTKHQKLRLKATFTKMNNCNIAGICLASCMYCKSVDFNWDWQNLSTFPRALLFHWNVSISCHNTSPAKSTVTDENISLWLSWLRLFVWDYFIWVVVQFLKSNLGSLFLFQEIWEFKNNLSNIMKTSRIKAYICKAVWGIKYYWIMCCRWYIYCKHIDENWDMVIPYFLLES